MLKLTKLIFIMLLSLITAHESVISVEANANLTTAETEFADLIVAADVKLDLNDRTNAEQYLLQANQILTQNPSINTYLQGHFNKVNGKLYMTNNAVTALQYFNTSLSQFFGNSLEQAETKMFIGIAYYHAGSYATAKSYFEEARTTFDLQNDMQKSAQALNNIGVVYFRQGDAQNAQIFCQNSLDINNQIGQRLNANRNQYNLAVFAGNSSATVANPLDGENNQAAGGTGTSGSTITTSGSGTVVVTTPAG
ncbi:MAG: tetratricopeptide repeat protein [Acidobacteriota bacterium]|nr:tetratricopeptide repeat protein [Acidobacteriota bacterium]